VANNSPKTYLQHSACRIQLQQTKIENEQTTINTIAIAALWLDYCGENIETCSET